MGKRKRKSKRQSPSPVSPAHPITMHGEPKSKKRGLTPHPQKSIPTSQCQDTSQLDACSPQVRKKLWNRFYELLILLLAYGKSQGKHINLDEASSEGYLDGSNKTLRKSFLDELIYI
jgi:hypothetical protein